LGGNRKALKEMVEAAKEASALFVTQDKLQNHWL
jgi:hypothetical protein